MADTKTCEHCGAVVLDSAPERVVVDGRSYYFCSEGCKLQWGEQGEIEDD
jgi:YHS domain-containing protein